MENLKNLKAHKLLQMIKDSLNSLKYGDNLIIIVTQSGGTIDVNGDWVVTPSIEYNAEFEIQCIRPEG